MKNLFTILFLAFSVALFAQKNISGKATYMSKTTVDMSSWGRNGQMSEAQKKQIAARMKNMLEKTYTLEFTKTESLYKENEKLEAPGSGRGFRFGGFGGGTKYKNTQDKVALEATEFFGKKFLVSDKMDAPKWELSTETKKIGNYTAYKATMTKDVDPLDWSNMRRRNRNNDAKKDEEKKDTSNVRKISDEIEMPKQLLVTAWYTPQIPISNGPAEYWGLPGLILEVSSGRTTMLCTEIVLNPSDEIEIEAPKKGEKITREEYTKTITQKMEEMRQMWRSRRGNRGGRF